VRVYPKVYYHVKFYANAFAPDVWHREGAFEMVNAKQGTAALLNKMILGHVCYFAFRGNGLFDEVIPWQRTEIDWSGGE